MKTKFNWGRFWAIGGLVLAPVAYSDGHQLRGIAMGLLSVVLLSIQEVLEDR